MNQVMKIGCAILLFAGVSINVHAEILVSWESNGVLRATGMEPGSICMVKRTSSLNTSFVTEGEGVVVASNGAMRVAVPVGHETSFFQVSGEMFHPVPAGMVKIPAGTNHGTNPLGVGESYSSSYPATYSLTLERFCMDQYEVTEAQWRTVYNWAISQGYNFDNVGRGKASNHPVQTVSWYDCVKWCNARSERDGLTPCYTVGGSLYKTGQSNPDCNFSADGYRLPTGEEWEYAARGGLNSKRFPWGDIISHNEANYNAGSRSYDASSGTHPLYNNDVSPYTSPVGSFPANHYGLYDMSGNIHEWCWDAQGSLRIMKGGNYTGGSRYARCGDSDDSFSQTYTFMGFGFRAVCR